MKNKIQSYKQGYYIMATLFIILIILVILVSFLMIWIVVKARVNNPSIDKTCLEDIGIKVCNQRNLFFEKINYNGFNYSMTCILDPRAYNNEIKLKFLNLEVKECTK